MSANERRAEIMRIMVARRQENMQVLAAELGVTDRTIRNDILVLTGRCRRDSRTISRMSEVLSLES